VAHLPCAPHIDPDRFSAAQAVKLALVKARYTLETIELLKQRPIHRVELTLDDGALVIAGDGHGVGPQVVELQPVERCSSDPAGSLELPVVGHPALEAAVDEHQSVRIRSSRNKNIPSCLSVSGTTHLSSATTKPCIG
jgi:hypothetical protein